MTQHTQRTTYKVFVYGSNTHVEELKHWCAAKSESLNIIATEPAWCPDYQPTYHYFSSGRQCGALDLSPALGKTTSGALLTIDINTLNALNRKEGAPQCYEQQELSVLTANGKQHQAITFITVPSKRSATHTPPSEDYERIVRVGQRGLGHNPLNMEQAAANEPITPIIKTLFVYGTLMHDESRSHVLPQYKITERRMGRVPGQLFDLGLHPALRPAQTHSDWVYGECITLENIESALQETDLIEGFHGFSDSDNVYDRRLLYVTLEDGSLKLAWVYFYHNELSAQRLEHGHWNPRHTDKPGEDLPPFSLCVDFNCTEFERRIDLLKHATQRLAGGTLNSEQATTFAINLLQCQRNEAEQALVPGSWCVIPGTEGIPSDARVEFAFMPTYWAIAFLCRFQLEYPKQAEQLPNLTQALDLALDFSVKRKLAGHGYEADLQRFIAVEILYLGRVPEWLTLHRTRGQALRCALRQAGRDFRRKVLNEEKDLWFEIPETDLLRFCAQLKN